MKLHTLALASLVAMASAPALAQDSTVTVTTTTTMTGIDYTNVDLSTTRTRLDDLRNYLNRILENERLGRAAGDSVQADAYHRTNDILVDNATALTMSLLEGMGSSRTVPPSLGDVRMHTVLVDSHLTHARMTSDFSVPIMEAKNHVDMIYQALDRNARFGMTGGSVTTAGTMDTSGTTTTTTTTPTMPDTTMTPDVTITPDSTTPTTPTAPDENTSPDTMANPDTPATPETPTTPDTDNTNDSM